MSSWYVVQSKSNKEFIAQQNLLRQKMKVYLPTTNHIISNKNLIKSFKPLFSGYLFVYSENINKVWHKINSTRGVKKIIHFGDNLGSLDDSFINFLKSKEINGSISLSDLTELKKGREFYISNDIFHKTLCKIDRVLDNEKIRVLLNFFGRQTKLVVSKNCIEPCIL